MSEPFHCCLLRKAQDSLLISCQSYAQPSDLSKLNFFSSLSRTFNHSSDQFLWFQVHWIRVSILFCKLWWMMHFVKIREMYLPAAVDWLWILVLECLLLYELTMHTGFKLKLMSEFLSSVIFFGRLEWDFIWYCHLLT